jgi:hypothetical protein
MTTQWKKVVLGLAVAGGVAATAAVPAQAGVNIGIGIGVPGPAPAPYAGPCYYHPYHCGPVGPVYVDGYYRPGFGYWWHGGWYGHRVWGGHGWHYRR